MRVGLEHLERSADQAVLAVHHPIDLGLQRRDRRLQPKFLGGDVVGQELLRRHRRLVQHRDAIGQALGEADALQPLRPVGGDFDVLQRALGHQFAAGHHLGQHHGDDLQVLDLVVGIGAFGAVLHHQHADGAPAAQQRHAEEGVERVFAGLRPIGEGRMVGRVHQVQRPAHADDFADQAFAGAHAGDVHGCGTEALGGEQLQVPRSTPQIEGADLGDHRLGDDPHSHVQTRLDRTGGGHGFANLPKQTARSTHG